MKKKTILVAAIAVMLVARRWRYPRVLHRYEVRGQRLHHGQRRDHAR